MDLEREFREITSLLEEVPVRSYIIYSEASILSLLILQYLLPGSISYFTLLIFMALLLGVIVLSSLMLVFLDYSMDLMGLLSGIFIFSGVSMAALQIEGLIGLGELEMTNIFFAVSSLSMMALGVFLLKIKVGKLGRRALFFMGWLFSLLLLLYLPLSEIYFPRGGLGYGEFTSAGLGSSLSILMSLLFIQNMKIEGIIERCVDIGDMRRLLGDLDGAEEIYKRGMEEGRETPRLLSRYADLQLKRRDYTRSLKSYNGCIDYLEDRNYRRAGIVAYIMGQPKRAIDYLQEALKKRRSAENWYMIGKIFEDLGYPEREKISYEKAIELKEGYWPAVSGLAKFYRGEDAEKMYMSALKSGGYRSDKRRLLFKIEGKGRFTPVFLHPAELRFWREKEHDIDIETVRPLLEEVLISLNIENPFVWEQAYSVVGEIDEISDLDSLLWDERGEESRLVKNLFRACLDDLSVKDELRGLIDTEMRDKALYILGLICGLEGDYQKGIDYLNQIDDMNLIPSAHAAKGSIYHLKGENINAKNSFRTSISLGYKGDETWEALEGISRELGQLEQRAFYSSKGLSLPVSLLTTDENNKIEDILDYASSGYVDKAFARLQNMNIMEEDKHLHMRGTINFLRGGYISACEIYKELINKNPEDAEAYFGRGISELGRNNNDKALSDIKKAIDLDGPTPIYVFYRGIINYRNGDLEKAVDDFEDVYKSRPGWEKNLYNLMMCKKKIY